MTMPPGMRRLLPMNTQALPTGSAAAATLEQRVGRLEGQPGAVIDAVEVLARGFENAGDGR
jgi:hypothetical protein